MSELSENTSNILSPRKTKSSLMSILKNCSPFPSNQSDLMNEDNVAFYHPQAKARRQFPSKKTEENLKSRAVPVPICQFYIPEKSKEMEIDSKVNAKPPFENCEEGIEGIAEDSFKVNIVAKNLLENDDFDCTMGSSGVISEASFVMGKNSSASPCLDMSYLTNTSTKFPHKGMSSERKSIIKLTSKHQERNLFSIKRKRHIPAIYSPDTSETTSNNSSMESCPSVAKKVKFYPLITSTPTKQQIYSGIQFDAVKKGLNFSDQILDEDVEINKLDQNVSESGNSLALTDANMMSQSFGKSEMSPMNSSDKIVKNALNDQPPISTLVEKFSSKIRLSMNSPGNSSLKRKIESADSSSIVDPPGYGSDDWTLGIGKYDAKYPADCVTVPTSIRLNAIAQDQYKPLKQSFDDSYKLAPIQESHRKIDDYNKPPHLSGRQRCLGFDSKMKPKTRLRRRYKSESDLFERPAIGIGESKQSANLTTEILQDLDDDSLFSNENSIDGSSIKLYSLSDPERNVSNNSEALGVSIVGQECGMEIFCEQMHDLQMDNT